MSSGNVEIRSSERAFGDAHAASRPGRLRVLHLGSPMGLYGAERWILALIRHLPSDRIESIVGAIRDAPAGVPEICARAAAMGFRTHVFDAPGKLSRAAIGQLRNFIRANDVRVLHTHGYKSDLIGALAVRGTNCRIVSTPHGWSSNAGWRLRLYEMLNRAAFWFHDAVVPLSQDLLKGLERLPGLRSKLHFIGNGVDLTEVDEVSGQSAALAEHRQRGIFVVGYIGQLIPRKGVDVLIRAFSAVGGQMRLCIVGEGAQRADLEALARDCAVGDQVEFFGYRPDRIELLKSFDLLVLPSYLEGVPRCVLEAMAARVPVLVSDIPGCRAAVQDGVTGLVFPPGNVEALAIKLRHATAHPSALRVMAAAAERHVREQFSAAAMAGAYAELYAQLQPAAYIRSAVRDEGIA